MHGARRVVMFCLLTAVLPTILLVIPLYLRHVVYADVSYALAESDVIEIVDGLSTVFCQAHSLKMNSSFHAFQLIGMPGLSTNRKHIRLKKSMSLPDDTLEYWGFYLLKGSTVVLSVCSRYPGSRVMVVKGEKNLKTCGLLDHKTEVPVQPHMATDQGQVHVTFDTEAKEVHSKPQISLPIAINENEVDEDFEGEHQSSENNYANDLVKSDNVTVLEQFVDEFISKHFTKSTFDDKPVAKNNTSSEKPNPRHLRHARGRQKVSDSKQSQSHKRNKKNKQKRPSKNSAVENEKVENKDLKNETHKSALDLEKQDKDSLRQRIKRQINPLHLLDGGVEHGGNAVNISELDDKESSVSSFENSLLTCYDGKILLAQDFLPSDTCTSVQAVEKHGTMETVHEVVADGYYYYIFYSDNDFVQNDIYAIFDIHKPTYQYANYSRACINETECTFPLSFWSDETVFVEVPTRDGIEHEGDDITFLVSSCYPRMSVYVIFPVAVLFLILGCAFM